MSGGGGSTTTTNNDPWGGVQPSLINAYGKTDQLLNDPLSFYGGRTYANFDPLQEQGMQQGLNYANNVIAPGAENYQNTLQQYMNAPLNIANDPAVQAMMAANQSNASDWLTREALPSTRTGAVAAGQLGGSRQGIAEGLAVGEATKALTNANAQTMLGAYGTAAGLAGNAGQMFPGAMQMGLTPYDYMQGVGAQYQGMDQRGIDEAMARYYYPEQSLWDKLAQASGIYAGTAGFGSGSSTTKNKSDPLGTAIGIGATVAPFFSDTRLKENVHPVFRDAKGRQWYQFEYIDKDTYGHGTKIGVMAQEIMDTDPEAVMVMPNGYLAVDYGRL